MGTSMSLTQMTRAEQETNTAAERLTSQIESAIAAVAVRSTSDIEELEACADRLERAARDLATALRELAHERRAAANNESE
jgi:polyhydroxyalkanoate synthesis regulator phasin